VNYKNTLSTVSSKWKKIRGLNREKVALHDLLNCLDWRLFEKLSEVFMSSELEHLPKWKGGSFRELEELKKELKYKKELADRAWKALTDRDLEVEELRGINVKLEKAKARIEELEVVDVELKEAKVRIEELEVVDVELRKAKARIEELEGVDVKLRKAKARIEELEGVDVKLEKAKARIEELEGVDVKLRKAKARIQELGGVDDGVPSHLRGLIERNRSTSSPYWKNKI
jgi:hypothetical protein